MSVNLYCGDPRTGKSYQAATVLIPNALAKGQRVVTNIRGVNREAIANYLVTQGVEAERIGQVLNVTNDDVLKSNFYPYEGSKDTIVLAGDLVVLDETWRFFKAGSNLKPNVLAFFREHGHLADEVTKFNCDIVLLTQLPTDLHKDILGIVEFTYRTTKLKELGLTNHFTIEVFSKIPKYRSKPLRVLQEKYDADKFCFYKSHVIDGAVETVIDKRGNVFASKFFKLILPLLMVFSIFAVYKLYKVFNPDPVEVAAPSGDVLPGAETGQVPPVAKTSVNEDLSEWRVVGYLHTGSNRFYYLQGANGKRIITNPPDFFNEGRFLSVKVDGVWSTNYSGTVSSSSSQSMHILNPMN